MVKESQSPGAGGGAGRKREEPEVGGVQVLLETRAGNAAREPQRSSVESRGWRNAWWDGTGQEMAPYAGDAAAGTAVLGQRPLP